MDRSKTRITYDRFDWRNSNDCDENRTKADHELKNSGMTDDYRAETYASESYEEFCENEDDLVTSKARSAGLHSQEQAYRTTTHQELLKSVLGINMTERRWYKVTTVFLGALCVLLLISIIVLWAKFTAERNKLKATNDSLSRERDQLQLERDEIQKSIFGMGWGFHKSSIYFRSPQKTTWGESRQFCRENGADLAIINNREEQEYIGKRFVGREAWIGLSDTRTEGVWKWVDGTKLSTEFWWTGEPNDFGNNEDCAIISYAYATSNISTWADYPCNHPVIGICERSFAEIGVKA